MFEISELSVLEVAKEVEESVEVEAHDHRQGS
jgi:hypothetical protein